MRSRFAPPSSLHAKTTLLRGVACLLSAALTSIAGADSISVEMVDRPNRQGLGCSGLTSVDLDGDGIVELYEASVSLGSSGIGNSVISRIAPIAAGALRRGVPVVPPHETLVVQLAATPPPVARLFSFGRTEFQSLGSTGVDVFSGAALQLDYTRDFIPQNALEGGAVADVVSSSQFRFGGLAAFWLGSYLAQTSEPLWTLDVGQAPGAIASVQADVDASPEWIVHRNGALAAFDADTGALDDSVPAPVYRSLTPVNLDDDPQLELLAAGNGRVATYELAPLSLRWSRDVDPVQAAAPFDRNGDGRAEIVVAADNLLRWLDASGAPQESANIDPLIGVGNRLAVVDVTEDGIADVVYSTSDSCSGGLAVRSQNLATSLTNAPLEVGPYDRFAVGNVDGDPADEIVMLSGVPNAQSEARVKVRVVDSATGDEQWQRTVPGPAELPGDDLSSIELAQIDTDPALEIVAYGQRAGSFLDGIVILDGDGTLLRRDPLPFDALAELRGAHYGVDADADGVAEIVTLTVRNPPQGDGLRVSFVDPATLALRWMGPEIAFSADVRAFALLQLDADPALEAVVSVPGVGVFAFDTGTRTLQWSVAGDARDVALDPRRPAQWLEILERTRLVRVVPATGATVAIRSLASPAWAIAADPRDPTHAVLAGEDRYVDVALPAGTVTASSRDLSNHLAFRGAVVPRPSATGTRWYAGNDVGVWHASVERISDFVFFDGFE